jgi:hypothetical protein
LDFVVIGVLGSCIIVAIYFVMILKLAAVLKEGGMTKL